MRELIKHYQDNLVETKISTQDQKEISKFIKRLESYISVPITTKDIKRMEAFSKNEVLVDFVLNSLNSYSYPKERDYPFDIISYWYSIALLMISEKETAFDFVNHLGKKLLNEKHPDLWLFRRQLEAFEGDKFSTLTQVILNYYLEQQKDLESYQWAKQIGLELPTDNNWMFYFDISTDGEFLSANGKENRIVIATSVYPLQGEKCFEIEVKGYRNKIQAWWPNMTERDITINGRVHTLKTKPSLLNFKALVIEIEALTGVTFNKTIFSKRFKGKIKNKNAIQKWLLQYYET